MLTSRVRLWYSVIGRRRVVPCSEVIDPDPDPTVPTVGADRRIHLKVKIKSLAAESRIIRMEELRQCGRTRVGLQLHRVVQVREESRASLLAYAYIRGRDYLEVESSAKTPPDVTRVARLVRSFGPREVAALDGDRAQEAYDSVHEWLRVGTTPLVSLLHARQELHSVPRDQAHG